MVANVGRTPRRGCRDVQTRAVAVVTQFQGISDDLSHERLIVAVAGSGGLAGLKRVSDAIDLLEMTRSSLIKELRDNESASWTEIGSACGMTKQGAQQRWLRQVRAGSFGLVSSVYERGRPSYPEAVVDWLVPASAREVLDLGAGTGKFTRLLVQRGLRVSAVDPSPEMRAELARSTRSVEPLDGRAEEIPFPDNSFDAVFLCQAWHWVDPDRAVPEIARVLRPGGTLGVAWNIRDKRTDWVASLEHLMHRGESRMLRAEPKLTAPFGHPQHMQVDWSDSITPDRLLDLVASRGHVITLPPAERSEVMRRVRQLINTHPSLAGRMEVSLPYITRCTKFQLISDIRA